MSGDQVNFGRFRLDLGRRELSRNGVPLHLGSRALDILCVLAAAKGDVVTKDNLMERVWPGLAVEESNIHVHISALRKALEDGKDESNFVVTVPGRGYRFIGRAPPTGPDSKTDAWQGFPVPDKPSIAVLPFTNMSGDSEQEYFADGITDDVITELSRFPELFVIARNSTFQYKGRSVDVRQVGRDLGVRYVLEGSIRRGGDRVRIGAQLIDAVTGAHRWAERFDRQLEDIFAIQDEVVCAIAPVLAAHVNKAEVERTLLKPPSTWQAYDFYLRGSETLAAYLSSYDGAELHEARRFLEQSLSVDPNYARAYVDLSYTYLTAWINAIDGDFLKPATFDRAYQLARKAVQLDTNLPVARAQLGMMLSFKQRHEEAIAEFERAQVRNPNFNDWRFANTLVFAGDAPRAIKVTDTLVRLDPFYLPLTAAFRGLAHYMLKEYEPAIADLVEAAGRSPKHRVVHQWLAAAYAQAGQLESAREEAAAVMRIQPDYTINGIAKIVSQFKRPEDAEHLFDGLRKAGLPEN